MSDLIKRNYEIGGYFEIDLPYYGNFFSDSYLKFQSGRAALRSIVEFLNVKRIMLPAYVCDAVIHSVTDAGSIVEIYYLDDALYPKNLPVPFPENNLLIYVNYFGLCEKNILRLISEMPRKNLIIDNSQALFALPLDNLATIYSPRKYVGVPDGGLLVAPELEIKEPNCEDKFSFDRIKHLLLRLAYTAEDGYSSYLNSENTFTNTIPLKMSRFTKRLLDSINMEKVKQKRRENFNALSLMLDSYNKFKWEIGKKTVPLCYPLILEKKVSRMKKKLAENKIYIPIYWLDAIKRIDNFKSIENELIFSCLAVPCDQRYSAEQMNYLGNIITSLLASSEK